MILHSGGHSILLFPADPGIRCIVYTHMDETEARSVHALLPGPRPALAVVTDIDWNRELSPWPAPRAFRGGEDFAGEGDAWLSRLVSGVIPDAENVLGFVPEKRVIAGYSLAGLFALYAVHETDLFHAAGCFSGSLWFDDFDKYMDQRKPSPALREVFFSLGDREEHARNPRLAAVGMRTRETEAHLRSLGLRTSLVMHPGGHFDNVPERIAHGISALTS